MDLEGMIYKRLNKDRINIDPLQTGGILTKEAKKTLLEFGDGYSICDYCKGRLDKIENPPIRKFVYEQLPKFIGCDIVRITNGAREGIYSVIHALTKPKDTIIVDSNRHYTTDLAAERSGVKIVEVPNSEKPEYKINVKDYELLIRKHNPSLIVLTYPDGRYGNLPNAKKLSEIALRTNVPYLINAAYAIGRMPIDMIALGADFIVGSGHKSMASCGPIGILGTKKKWEDVLFKKSENYPNKELELLGCTARGASIMALMSSFPTVKKRVIQWEDQVEKARWFSSEMEKLGMKQLGEKPHNHDLMFFESPGFYRISQGHKKGGFFLYEELKKRGIWGIKPGLTKQFKLSTFSASKKDLEKVLSAFKEILNK